MDKCLQSATTKTVKSTAFISSTTQMENCIQRPPSRMVKWYGLNRLYYENGAINKIIEWGVN
jgi:hypothetical protein